MASAATLSRYFLLFFALALLSLAGAWLGVMATGGFADWTRPQFVGLFAVIEAAVGLANIITPNIWALPVAEWQTSERRRARIDWPVLLHPHWGGAARAGIGALLLGFAAWHEGAGAGTVALAPFVALFALLVVAVSAVCARWGVDHPDADVVQFVVRHGGRAHEVQPISLGASVVQLLLSVLTIPAVRLLPPSAFFAPEIGPAPATLGAMALAAGIAVAAAAYAWRGRVATAPGLR